MNKWFQQRSKLTSILVLAVLVTAAGCGGGGSDAGLSSPTAPGPAGAGSAGSAGSTGGTGGTAGGSGGSSPAASQGKLALLLTDNPIDEIAELWVFVSEVKVKPAQQPVLRIPSTIGLVDLLTLQGGVTELLGEGEVEAGVYQFIELLLDEDQSFVVLAGDAPQPQEALKIPSEKIKVAGGPFEILPDFTTTVTVDFDAEKSLKKTGNGRYQLQPHVTVTAVSVVAGT